MGETTRAVSREGLSPSAEGKGPLLERDYWSALQRSRLRPSEIMAEVKAHFASFAPSELARFSAADRPLRLGPTAEVLDPPEVRSILGRIGAELVARYNA